MRRSELFATVSRESEADTSCVSQDLALRAGLVHSYGSGTFGYTTLGKKVLDNIEQVVRQEMEAVGCQEVSMNLLQTSDMWKKSGRWRDFEGEEFFHFKNRDDRDFCLAPTHEEAVVELVRKHIDSYRDLDFTVYQIGRKFRDDHARKGLLRAKEFRMKDAYSFHRTGQGLDSTYREMLQAYKRIFDRLGLDYTIVGADTGSMGGTESNEFLVKSDAGSDTYLECVDSDCSKGTKDLGSKQCGSCGSDLEETEGIEVGHLFKLGTRYSESMNLTFQTRQQQLEEVIMGCYGIGVSRLIAAVIEQNHDEEGITWNSEVSAFNTAVIAARHEEEVLEKAEEIYRELDSGDTLLYDTRQSAGEKFAEADLLGICNKIVVGNSYLDNGVIEIEDRDGEKQEADADQLKEGGEVNVRRD